MQIDDVLEWARDGKWAILENHPQVIAEAFEQLADLREQTNRPTTLAVDVASQSAPYCKICNGFHSPSEAHY